MTYTSYSLNRSATDVQDGAYGQGAYARLWASLSYNTSVPFTTTASPTPVASSELVFPPPLYTGCPDSANECVDCYKLPKDFLWGVAGSAFQIEGGLTEAGRGPSVLDVFGSLPNTADLANAEVADMNYWLYKQDIARLAAIGVPNYSFSIAWTRIVPFGKAESPVNEEGLKHYEEVIETCLQYGIRYVIARAVEMRICNSSTLLWRHLCRLAGHRASRKASGLKRHRPHRESVLKMIDLTSRQAILFGKSAYR